MKQMTGIILEGEGPTLRKTTTTREADQNSKKNLKNYLSFSTPPCRLWSQMKIKTIGQVTRIYTSNIFVKFNISHSLNCKKFGGDVPQRTKILKNDNFSEVKALFPTDLDQKENKSPCESKNHTLSIFVKASISHTLTCPKT